MSEIVQLAFLVALAMWSVPAAALLALVAFMVASRRARVTPPLIDRNADRLLLVAHDLLLCVDNDDGEFKGQSPEWRTAWAKWHSQWMNRLVTK